MNWQDHISIDPEVLLGKPVIKGTYITVEVIMQRLADGQTVEELLISYPHISREALMACLQYVRENHG